MQELKSFSNPIFNVSQNKVPLFSQNLSFTKCTYYLALSIFISTITCWILFLSLTDASVVARDGMRIPSLAELPEVLLGNLKGLLILVFPFVMSVVILLAPTLFWGVGKLLGGKASFYSMVRMSVVSYSYVTLLCFIAGSLLGLKFVLWGVYGPSIFLYGAVFVYTGGFLWVLYTVFQRFSDVQSLRETRMYIACMVLLLFYMVPFLGMPVMHALPCLKQVYPEYGIWNANPT